MLLAKEKKYTIKDYRLLPEGSPYQLIEGEFVMTPAPSPRHQIISANLFKRIAEFVDKKGIGIVLYSPVDIYPGEENAYQPDLIFISKEKQEIIKEDGIYGAPDLIVEILSPATAYYDIKKKFRVYEKNGVQEYWIVDPEMSSVEIYTNEKSHFSLITKAEGEGEVESVLLKGFKSALKDILKIS